MGGVSSLLGFIWFVQWIEKKLYARRAKRLFERRNDSDADWWNWYNFYLTTSEWAMRRQGVLLRSQGRCEKCGRFVPVQTHHITYERVGHELPEDLAALCYECHRGEHPGKRF